MVALVSVDIRPALLVLERVSSDVQKSPVRFQKGVSDQIAERRPRILQDAHSSGLQSPLPFIWSLNPVKQRRARAYYFAVIVPKGSPGGRYRRTGALDAATQVNTRLGATSGEAALENAAAGALFVFGLQQVPSHSRSKHPLFAQVAQKWRPILEQDVTGLWLNEGKR